MPRAPSATGADLRLVGWSFLLIELVVGGLAVIAGWFAGKKAALLRADAPSLSERRWVGAPLIAAGMRDWHTLAITSYGVVEYPPAPGFHFLGILGAFP